MQQSGDFEQQLQAQAKARWSARWAAITPVLVVVIWLLASWSATAAELALAATAGTINNGRATVTAFDTSSGNADAMIRL